MPCTDTQKQEGITLRLRVASSPRPSPPRVKRVGGVDKALAFDTGETIEVIIARLSRSQIVPIEDLRAARADYWKTDTVSRPAPENGATSRAEIAQLRSRRSVRQANGAGSPVRARSIGDLAVGFNGIIDSRRRPALRETLFR